MSSICQNFINLITKLNCKKGFPSSESILQCEPRLEVVCADPTLFLYHDILTPGEISYMKTNVLSLLAAATVQDVSVTNGKKVSNERTQSSGWLWDHDHSLLYQLSKKVSLLTGLNTFRPRINGNLDSRQIEAEAWQLGLYGSGGHYLPHFDAFPSDSLPTDAWKDGIWVGNRYSS